MAWPRVIGAAVAMKATCTSMSITTHSGGRHSDIGGTLSQVVKRYDASGRLNFQSYPLRGVTDVGSVVHGARTIFDALDRAVRVDQDSELGVLSTTTEYLSGLRTRTTNPRGYATTVGYMAWDTPRYDLPLWSVHPEGKVIELDRHPHFGWPQQLKQRSTDGSVQATRRYVYGNDGQLCKTIEPETGTTVLRHDAAGNLAWSASGLDLPDPLACSDTEASVAPRKVNRAYDARNRLTALAFPDGRGNQVWTYTADGLPESITTWNGSGSTQPVVNAYHYNQRRLLDGQGDSVSQPGWYAWGIGYGYDRNGALATQRYPTGLMVDYAPNALGQATLVRNAHQPAVVYASGVQYHPNGSVKQFTYGNGLVHTMTQNARQLPERVASTGNALDYGYDYDRNGNPIQILDHVTGTPTARHRWMTYDALDRLTSAASVAFGGSDHTHRYAYDALDNLKSWKHAGVKDYAEYVYDARNRLTNIRNSSGATVVGLGYDLRGNLSNKNGQSYLFDDGNRLRGTSSGETYLYDGLGRRVQALKADGSTTLWQYGHGGQLLFSWDGPNNQKTHEYVYLAGSLLATIDHHWPSNVIIATKYQHTDALGSPVAVSNEVGSVIERNEYEPYGAVVGKLGYSGIGYTGHVMDGGTGLTYMQQRYYDQSLGRFLSVDPVTAYGGDFRFFNRYQYAFNSPIRFTDPDGRAPPGCGDGTCQSYDRRLQQSLEISYTTMAGMLMAIDGIEPGEEMGLAAILMQLGSRAAAPRVRPVVNATLTSRFRVFRDVNQTARSSADRNKSTLIADRVAAKEAELGRPLPNGNMATAHAEIDAMQQAYDAGATQGARMILSINGKPICGYCYGDIAAMADRSGLRSLLVHEKATGKRYFWEPGMRSIKEAPK